MSAFRIGKFQVVAKLGTGAHSTILQVRRNADGKSYALKVVPVEGREDQKFLDQAKHEFRVAQLLGHPNLIKVFTLELMRNWLFQVKKAHLLIEYVNGKKIDEVRGLKLPHQVQIFQKVAAGLAHMHRRGVYHADLKPNNILLSKAGEVKVIDYGLAWIKGEDKERIQGTPEYMAPEQAKDKTVNERSDIYNLGATMYRLLTFRHPPSVLSEEDNNMPLDRKTWQLLFKPVEEYNPKVPARLCQLVNRCLSYKPGDRPERVSEVQEELDTLGKQLVRGPEDELESVEW